MTLADLLLDIKRDLIGKDLFKKVTPQMPKRHRECVAPGKHWIAQTDARVMSVAAAVVAVTLVACGTGGSSGVTAARVDGTRIAGASVAHWMAVLAPQHQVPDPPSYARCAARHRGDAARSVLVRSCAQLYEELKERALDYLISSVWLSGEVAREGMAVSEAEVRAQVHRREQTFEGGHAEFEASIRAIGHTLADVELEIEDELAAKKLKQRLTQDESAVGAAQIAAYYKQHIAQFKHPEERQFHIVENISSKQAARMLMEQFASGRRNIVHSGESLYESLERPANMRGARAIVKAIFAVKPHTISEPVAVGSYYFLVKVAAVTRAYTQSLAQANRLIVSKLARDQRRRTLATFVTAWSHRWTAATRCSRGYVVPRCKQYHGPPVPQEPLGL